MKAVTLSNPQQARPLLAELWDHIKRELTDGRRLILKVEPEKRTNEQNRLMWAALGEVARQVDWHGQKLEPAEWKDIFTAALKRQKVVPGIDGGFVVLGSSTSRMGKAEFSELMELVFSFGADKGVTFKE